MLVWAQTGAADVAANSRISADTLDTSGRQNSDS